MRAPSLSPSRRDRVFVIALGVGAECWEFGVRRWDVRSVFGSLGVSSLESENGENETYLKMTPPCTRPACDVD